MIFHSMSKKPIVIAGNGCRGAGACDALRQFHEKTKIPIVTTMNAVDLISENDRIGFIGVYGNRVANLIVEHSDLVISIGARLGLRQIGNKREFFAPNATLIRADIDEYELGRNIKDNEEKYIIDAKDFILQLMMEKIPEYNNWNIACNEARDLLEPYDKDLGNLCIEKISSLLPDSPVVAVDIGQTQCWVAQSMKIRGNSGRILIGGSYGSMGCGLPYAIGACFASKKKQVFCVTGDGGLQMNIQELQTVASEKLPIKILVINNKALGKIAEIQTSSYEKRMMITDESSGYSVPDFEKIALAYGIKATTIYDYDDLNKLTGWFDDDDSCLINIILPEANILLPKMNWNEREMKPLLPRDVMDKARTILNSI